MSLTMADDDDDGGGGRIKTKNSLLRRNIAIAVTSVQWSYAIFWSSSPTQSGVLEWGEGCFNGDIKKRKKRSHEAPYYKHGLHRSRQLRKLYFSMLEEDTTTITTDDDDHHNDDDDDHNSNCNMSTISNSMMLSPDDLSDEEWYYLVSMSYVFSPNSQCLPGRALAVGETIWLCNAQYAENKLFSRSLLARSASIQTVVCFPHLGGVIELGVTELISEDQSLIQRIKSCLLETWKLDGSLSNFVEKNQMRIKHDQTLYDIIDKDLHYKTTVSTVLKYAAAAAHISGNSIHQPPNLVSSNCSSSFLRWKQPNSVLHQYGHRNLQQNVLRKILQDVPLMHTNRILPSRITQFDPNSDRRRENEKFSVLRTMLAPTVNEFDKESILNNTIKYLKELESRVEELESCMGSVNFVERQRKKHINDMTEETSGNYDDDSSTKIDGKYSSGEIKQATSSRSDYETNLRVKLKETEVGIQVRCSNRDYIVADIMETLSNLHMDAFSVRSHTLNGFLTLNIKAKFRGNAVASVGMIKRELRRVTGENV
ncbi:unnamed protein product [Cochlearia groenlandica]